MINLLHDDLAADTLDQLSDPSAVIKIMTKGKFCTCADRATPPVFFERLLDVSDTAGRKLLSTEVQVNISLLNSLRCGVYHLMEMLLLKLYHCPNTATACFPSLNLSKACFSDVAASSASVSKLSLIFFFSVRQVCMLFPCLHGFLSLGA